MLRQACSGQEVHSGWRDRPTRLAALLLARSGLNPRGRNTPRGNEKPWLGGVVARPMLRGQRCREVVGSCAAMRLTRGTACFRRSTHLAFNSEKINVESVMFPPGRAMLATSPVAK